MMPGNVPKSNALLEIANIGYKGHLFGFLLALLCPQTNAEIFPKITSYYCMFFKQSLRPKFVTIETMYISIT